MDTFESIVPILHEFIVASGEEPEGNCLYAHRTMDREEKLESKRTNLWRAGTEARKLCEIGFNAGHSAALLGLGSMERHGDHTELVIFDLAEHAYTRPCWEFLQDRYFSELRGCQFVAGDSRVMIPAWMELNRHHVGTFDLVHVDGGHTTECIVSDLFSAYHLARPGGRIIVDDINSTYIMPVVNLWMMSGLLEIDLGFEATSVHPHVVLTKKNLRQGL
jgi:hypothetical protein